MVVLHLANRKLALGLTDDELMALDALVGAYIAQRGWVKGRESKAVEVAA